MSKGAFNYFHITNFRDPDTTSNPFACSILRKGDLLIRDLGYFSFESFLEIIKKNAYFLSRFKLHIPVFDPVTLHRINLVKLLKGKAFFDGMVFIGAHHDAEVRMVIEKLPPEVTNARVRKAKADKRNIKMNHSKEYYALLGYSIYITNVKKSEWDTCQVAEAYRYRWYIENIFKSWKSYLPSCYTIQDNYATKLSVEMHFYMFLIFVCMTIMPLYNQAMNYCVLKKSSRQISLFKLCSFVRSHIYQIINQKINKKMINQLYYYCRYDTRSDRENIVALIFNPKLS